jgi:hypothetical protein
VGTKKPVFEAAWEVIVRRTFDRAMAATELAVRSLQAEGEIRRDADEIWVGDRQLGKDRELLSRLARATGLGFAVYSGNRRIAAATVLDAGCAPNVGEAAAAPLADTVLRRGEVFRGNIEYAGRRYISVGRPIFSRDGAEFAPLGMIEAFQDEEVYFDLLAASARSTFETQTEDLEKRADSLEWVIGFIDTVARKLQLLALNGNIIAAQAGKQGTAFRVVCSELSTLAEQAKTTSSQVRRFLRTISGDHDESGQDAANTYGAFDDHLAEARHASEALGEASERVVPQATPPRQEKANAPARSGADSGSAGKSPPPSPAVEHATGASNTAARRKTGSSRG